MVNPSSAEVNLSINAIVCLSDPISAEDPAFSLIPLSKEIANFNFTQVYNFEMDFTPADTGEAARYNQKFIYLAVATKSADGKVVQYSKTRALISA